MEKEAAASKETQTADLEQVKRQVLDRIAGKTPCEVCGKSCDPTPTLFALIVNLEIGELEPYRVCKECYRREGGWRE